MDDDNKKYLTILESFVGLFVPCHIWEARKGRGKGKGFGHGLADLT